MKSNPVVYFEIPADDKERMKSFYANVFGWQMTQLGAKMGNYVLVRTTATDEKGMVQTPGAINGGIFDRNAPDQHTRITIAVDDIRASMKAVAQAGGKVLGGMRDAGEPDEIPGVGLYATIIDTEGNRVSILQPFPLQS